MSGKTNEEEDKQNEGEEAGICEGNKDNKTQWEKEWH